MAHRKNFTPSDDALILEQPVSRIGIEKLATMLHTSPGSSCVGLTNSASRWPPDIMTRLSTRERTDATMDSSTRY
jgi:hypothetical protein